MSKTDFISYTNNISREGLNALLAKLESSGFYEAPASSRFHGNYEGGLCDHSTHVFEELTALNEYYGGEYSIESVAVVALFHDLCKMEFYSIGSRNVKDEATGRWFKKPFYMINEKECFGGHGSKSVFITQSFIQLTFEEASAINAHMGPWDKQDYGNPGGVYQQNKLAWMLHVADERATYYRDRTDK